VKTEGLMRPARKRKNPGILGRRRGERGKQRNQKLREKLKEGGGLDAKGGVNQRRARRGG